MNGSTGRFFSVQRGIATVFLIAIVVVVFGNCLNNGFVWDDTVDLVGNTIYKEFRVHEMFTTLSNGREFLPLRDLSYALDYSLWGENPTGFHFTNLFLYGANIVAIYWLMILFLPYSSVQGNDAAHNQVAFWTACLFAVHPLHSEPIAWVTGRNVLLSGLFFFLSLICFLVYVSRSGRTSHASYPYVLSIIFFLGALLSKATAVILPLLFLPYLAYSNKRLLPRIVALVPFFTLSVVFSSIYRRIGIATEQIDLFAKTASGSDMLVNAAVSTQIPLFYLKQIFFPTGLSAEYDTLFFPHWMSSEVLGAAGILIVTCIVVTVFRKAFPEGVAGGWWYIATLIPVLHFFPTNPVVADRYSYLPLLGVVFPLVSLPFRLMHRWRLLGISVLVTVALIFAWESYGRNQVWKSETTLWEATINSSPRQVKAYVNLADAYFKEGKFALGLNVLQKTANLNPRFDFYDFYLGNYHLRRNDLHSAAKAFSQAVAYNDQYIDALFALANVYEWLGETERARLYYQRTIAARTQDDSGFRKAAAESLRRLQQSAFP